MIPAAIQLQRIPLISLLPYKGNARTHSRKQIRQIADSIKMFGFLNPVLADQHNNIIAGHGRYQAAKLLGMSEVPVLRIEHLSEDERRAYIIADNRLAELAGWDEDILAIELQHLVNINFDVVVTGFELPKIDLIIQQAVTKKDKADEFEVDDNLPLVTRLGDLWQLGDHRILCANALLPESYHVLLGDEKAQLVFTDPPYNVKIAGHVCGLGKVQHSEFPMASGEMSQSEFTGFLSEMAQRLTSYSVDGSIHYICMDWRHMQELLSACGPLYSELKAVCVWNKDNGGMGSLYRSKHEMIFVYKHGNAPHINNIELGKHGRYRTNVWDYAGQNSLHSTRDEELALHPTVKPVGLVADAILDCSRRGSVVLDPFGGSGTTLIASHKTGRRARLIELEPKYVDVTIRRWQALSGENAIHLPSGQHFNEKETHHG